MQLFLTTGTPSNAVYTDASGAPQYKVNTPFKVHHRTTSISRVVEHEIPRRHSGSSSGGNESPLEEGVRRFANLATIDWRVFDSSVIHFRGQELAVRDFFRKEGWGWYGRLVLSLCSHESALTRFEDIVCSQPWMGGSLNGSSEHIRHRQVPVPYLQDSNSTVAAEIK
jgi:hypothetical protein